MVLLYMVLATTMFFFTHTGISVDQFTLMYHYLLGIPIILLGAVTFLVRPQPERAKLLIKHSFVLSIPYYVSLLSSFIIWTASLSTFRTIISGFARLSYMFLAIGVAAATLYTFGNKGIWYCLASMILANILRALLIAQNAGFGLFLKEFNELLLSFSGKTGSLIAKMEVHDETFAFGIFLIFLLVCKKDIKHNFSWIFLTLLCFLLGLKRIAVLGVLVAGIATASLHLFKKKTIQPVAVFIFYIAIVVSFIYIVAIHEGLFGFLENVLHINTMSRKIIYEKFAKYYEISITYMGKGTRFCETNWVDPRGNRTMSLHNDFLRMYAETGFIGYFVWIWTHFVFRIKYFFKVNEKAGVLIFSLLVYSYINYLTDNTVLYYYTTIAFSITVMACCMKDMELFENAG